MYSQITILNGKPYPVENSLVSTEGLGVLFGFGVYESILIYKGRPVTLDAHISRLDKAVKSCGFVGVKIKDIEADVYTCIAKNGLELGQVLIFVLSGKSETKHDVIVVVKEFQEPLNRLRSIDVELLPEFRGDFGHLKLTSCAPSILMKQQINRRGFHEAIMHDGDFVTEALSSAVCIVNQGKVIIVESTKSILPSISMKNLCVLFDKHQIPYSQASVTLEMLCNSEEIWLLSTTWGLRSVRELNFQNKKYKFGSSFAEEVFMKYIEMLELQQF